jgi:hypothetical protein
MGIRFVLVLAVAATAFAAGNTAVIVDSGSTNLPGYRIAVEKSGKATYTPTRGAAKAKKKNLSKSLTQRFYKDLDAAKPLSGLTVPPCMKSASFGSTRTVEFAGAKTPDLSCGDGGNAKIAALAKDAAEIVKAFEVM